MPVTTATITMTPNMGTNRRVNWVSDSEKPACPPRKWRTTPYARAACSSSQHSQP